MVKQAFSASGVFISDFLSAEWASYANALINLLILLQNHFCNPTYIICLGRLTFICELFTPFFLFS
jgi:hypothetical protein